MADWLNKLVDLEQAGIPAVLITVAAVDGSAPREAGAKMVVTASELHGTIGGGQLELRATEIARTMLRRGGAASLRKFPLGPTLGQCCGGHVTLLFEPRRAEAFTVALFGAGHVGKAVAQVLGTLACRVRWFDPRPDEFPAHVPANATVEVTPAPEREVATLPDGAWLLVMTHSHAVDLGICARALQSGRFAHVGLIGSATKRARFEKRFHELGIEDAKLRAFVCPIGIDGIRGKQPGEIAVSAVADLLRRREALLAGLPVLDAAAEG